MMNFQPFTLKRITSTSHCFARFVTLGRLNPRRRIPPFTLTICRLKKAIVGWKIVWPNVILLA